MYSVPILAKKRWNATKRYFPYESEGHKRRRKRREKAKIASEELKNELYKNRNKIYHYLRKDDYFSLINTDKKNAEYFNAKNTYKKAFKHNSNLRRLISIVKMPFVLRTNLRARYLTDFTKFKKQRRRLPKRRRTIPSILKNVYMRNIIIPIVYRYASDITQEKNEIKRSNVTLYV